MNFPQLPSFQSLMPSSKHFETPGTKEMYFAVGRGGGQEFPFAFALKDKILK